MKKNTEGTALWGRAIRAIPGGNGLLSKRPDRYAPDLWPSYFTRASGVDVYDLDGNHFVDMAQMGIGSAILGYANPELNADVIETIGKGVNCTLNAPEEVLLAERLLELNDFAGGVRFAKSGGEAMAIAVRIARAHSGRDKVLFSGYHGWCDWYLATNIGPNDGLGEHLIPGLSTSGVPSGLANTAIPFTYDDIASLEKVVRENPDAGVICIEGARYDFPSDVFLARVSELAEKHNMVVISDEITSGWRMTDGGVYKINGFSPDIVVYAKAMGGGFAISAVVGSADVMNAAQDTFMSSTMWTERVGFAAALSTIKILCRDKVWDHLNHIGGVIGDGWERLAASHNIRISITDFKPLITMKFQYHDHNQELVTLFNQEMLKRGFLAAPSVYVSAAHSVEVVERYLNEVDQVFGILARFVEADFDKKFLETRLRSDSFARITP